MTYSAPVQPQPRVWYISRRPAQFALQPPLADSFLLAMSSLKYLSAYSEQTREQVSQLVAQNRLGEVLLKRYPKAHDLRTDKALYQYVQELKTEFLRNAEPINKVGFDSKIHVINHALGLHTSISRIQGGKLKAKHEIRIAALFKEVPIEFLRMIAVHELAHVKEKQHDKAFYKLCTYMEPDYHQYEFDLRLYLTELDISGRRLWSAEKQEDLQGR